MKKEIKFFEYINAYINDYSRNSIKVVYMINRACISPVDYE